MKNSMVLGGSGVNIHDGHILRAGQAVKIHDGYCIKNGAAVKAFSSFPDQISAQGSGYYYYHYSEPDDHNYSETFYRFGQASIVSNGMYVVVNSRANIKGGGESITGTASESYLRIDFSDPISVRAGDAVMHFSSLQYSFEYDDNPGYGTQGISMLDSSGSKSLLFNFNALGATESDPYSGSSYDIISPIDFEIKSIRFSVNTHYNNSHSNTDHVTFSGTVESIMGELLAGKTIDPNVWDYDD